jgi:hypothetical protein
MRRYRLIQAPREPAALFAGDACVVFAQLERARRGSVTDDDNADAHDYSDDDSDALSDAALHAMVATMKASCRSGRAGACGVMCACSRDHTCVCAQCAQARRRRASSRAAQSHSVAVRVVSPPGMRTQSHAISTHPPPPTESELVVSHGATLHRAATKERIHDLIAIGLSESDVRARVCVAPRHSLRTAQFAAQVTALALHANLASPFTAFSVPVVDHGDEASPIGDAAAMHKSRSMLALSGRFVVVVCEHAHMSSHNTASRWRCRVLSTCLTTTRRCWCVVCLLRVPCLTSQHVPHSAARRRTSSRQPHRPSLCRTRRAHPLLRALLLLLLVGRRPCHLSSLLLPPLLLPQVRYVCMCVRDSVMPTAEGKKVYKPDFLLSFQARYTDKVGVCCVLFVCA